MRQRDNSRRGHRGDDRIEIFVNDSGSTQPLLDFLRHRLPPHFGRNDLKRLLKYGYLRLDGTVTSQFDAPVAPGAAVEVNHTRPFVVFSHPRLKIVYEDNDVIVVNKGYGVLSVGTGAAGREITAYGLLKDYLKEVNPANKIFVVHRLDRATSGLMMFAKNIEAQTAMQHNWNNMVLDRRYVALLEGCVENDEGEVRSYMGETSKYEVYSVPTQEEGTKLAVTRYRVLGRGSGYTLCEFTLDTGRKNQIRVHAADMGHPVVGDRKYGAKSSPLGRMALHACVLRFVHPVTRRDMYFTLPVPAKFTAVMRSGRRTGRAD